jgi:hypothetical protein
LLEERADVSVADDGCRARGGRGGDRRHGLELLRIGGAAIEAT